MSVPADAGAAFELAYVEAVLELAVRMALALGARDGNSGRYDSALVVDIDREAPRRRWPSRGSVQPQDEPADILEMSCELWNSRGPAPAAASRNAANISRSGGER